MAGIEVVEVEKEEFLALEEFLGAAERHAAACKGQQGKRLFQEAVCAKDTEHAQAAKMPCVAGQQGMLFGAQLPQQIQQPQLQLRAALPSGCMQQQHPHQALALQDNINFHTSCIHNSSMRVCQLQQHYPWGDNMQQQQHRHSEQQHKQQCVSQHIGDNQQREPQHQQSSSCQAAGFSMPAPTVGHWSGASITSNLQRQQSVPDLDSKLGQQQQQPHQQQQRLPVGQPHQQQPCQQQQGYRLQQPLQYLQQQPQVQQLGRQEWQQSQKHIADPSAARQTTQGVAPTTAAVAGGSGGGHVAQHWQAGASSTGTRTAESSINSIITIEGTVKVGKCIGQHGNAFQVGQSNTAAPAAEGCCAGSGGQGWQAAAMGCDGCVAGVVNPQAAATHVGVLCAGSGTSPAVISLLPGTADAGVCCAGSGSGLRNVHGCSSRSIVQTQNSGGTAQCNALGVAGNLGSRSGGAAAAVAASGSRQTDQCNSSGPGAAAGSGSGGSSRRLPASLANNERSAAAAAAAARGQQGSIGSIHQLQQQQQQQAQQTKPKQQQQAGLQKPLQLEYHGQARYAYQPHEVDWLCQQLLDAGPPGVVGFDLEWRPTYRKGCAPNKTALLQLAYAVDKHGKDWRPKPDGKGVMVLLLHVLYSGITPQLQNILSREDIVKVGVNISGDANKLLADFNVGVESTSELSDIANGRQLSCVDGITSNIEHKRWSLAGLVQEVMCAELPKPNDIRCGNWERVPLEKDQQQYAAMDAFACLLLHWEMQDLPERLTLSQQLRQGMMERAAADADDDYHQ